MRPGQRRSQQWSSEFEIRARPSLPGVGWAWAWAWAWAWMGGLCSRTTGTKFRSPELGGGVDRGFTLGAQAGHLSLMVAGLAKAPAPRLLWKGRCQGLPGLLAT